MLQKEKRSDSVNYVVVLADVITNIEQKEVMVISSEKRVVNRGVVNLQGG